ncbi:MAG TPA: LamG-like jellyroll fold domain-containing protein [Sedimentisphaerales bacterium]|nr:LamG-like jellyroll fold domain-containing protein [Sedimentisphaerales bacterium]
MKRTIALVLVLALGITAEVANADFTFGTPTNLGPTVNSSSIEGAPSVTADGLELYFECDRPSGFGSNDMWVTTRATTNDPWGEPVNLGPTVNTSYWDGASNISADGLSLFFASDRPGGSGEPDLYVTTRATKDDPWGEPVNLGPTLNSPYFEDGNYISADGLALYFSSRCPGGYGDFDIWVTTRATLSDPWGEPVSLGPTINTSAWDFGPHITADGRTLLFSSGKPGGVGGHDMYVTTRATTSDPWKEPVNLGPVVNSSADERCPNLSADGFAIRFHSNRFDGYGGWDIWQAPILPVVDLNGDRVVDSADMCIMVDHWGTDDPLCDIGPTPLGDGIVDVQDLIVLAEHLFEDYRLVAHWKLDEEVGDIAYDGAGEFDATFHGEPAWQPEGGIMGGALQFDGIDDCVETNFILNPADGSFSVFAWIKGGVPGQVIISQADTIIDTPVGPGTNPGSTWLGANPSDGRLMTGLMDIYFGPLESESVITDGQWHHIGLVYDLTAMKRRLYVDGAEVVVDAGYVGGVQSSGGLYIGAGQDLGTGTFFSGLIDDVRIYDEALAAEEIEALAR